MGPLGVRLPAPTRPLPPLCARPPLRLPTAAAPARAHLLKQLRDDLLEPLHHQWIRRCRALPGVNHLLCGKLAGKVDAALR